MDKAYKYREFVKDKIIEIMEREMGRPESVSYKIINMFLEHHRDVCDFIEMEEHHEEYHNGVNNRIEHNHENNNLHNHGNPTRHRMMR